MAQRIITNAWSKLEVQTGTIQNVSQTTSVEVSEVQTDDSGQILLPGHDLSFSGVQLYARSITKEDATVRVSPFAQAVGGSSGGSGGASSYVLPTASASRLGGVKVGNGINVTSDGTISVGQINLGETYVVASEAAMLGLSAKKGDVAVRSDAHESYILQGNNPASLSSWVKLETPTDSVTSVNGQKGNVVISSPTKVSELQNDANYITPGTINNYASKLDVASATQLGGIKVGNTLTIDADGVLDSNLSNVATAWASDTVYSLNSVVYTDNGFYISKAAHTSAADFMTDLLAGKWTYIGKEGANNITQEVLYENYSVGKTGTQVALNGNWADYDYVFFEVFGDSVRYASGLMKTKDGTGTLVESARYYDTSSLNYEVKFYLISPNTMQAVYITTAGITSIVVKKVIGIKFNSLTTSDIAEMSMPSDVYVSVPAGTDYTAPANGYFVTYGRNTTTSIGIIHAFNKTLNVVKRGVWQGSTSADYCATTKVRKGDIVVGGGGSSNATVSSCKFYYTIGDAKALGLI